ncbi:helix-turn-helix domain-containing protein [Aminobacter sp. P9b]
MVDELERRESTGRGRCRAWGVVQQNLTGLTIQ